MRFVALSLCLFIGLMTTGQVLANSVETGATPEQSAFFNSPLGVLSDQDVARYREIFNLQEKGAWKKADAKISALENDILMGHVLYQRYLHPTAYRSKFSELKKWMAFYADHPNASKIYRLAQKRRPRRASNPVRPIPRKWRGTEAFQLHPDLKADQQKVSVSRLRQIEGRVRYLIRRENASTALKEIKRHLQNNRITKRQYDRMRSWAAASYYYQGYIDAAKRISTEVANRNGETAVLAHWIAGLIAFRAGDMVTSHDHFSTMSQIPYQDGPLRAGAGFWAARTALAAGRPEGITPNLEIAAGYPFTFYGQLAMAQLGQDYDFDWDGPTLTKDGFKRVADAHPGVARAAALVQVGRKSDAELEMRRANGAIDDALDYDLMAIAMGLDLPASQIEIALAGKGKHLEAGLFPIPEYTPNNGFQTDRAVIYALMRQESKFRLDAKSRVGARGLMQLMPRTASFVANDRSLRRQSGRDRLYDPGLNLQIGQTYVNQLITRYTDGDLFKTAVAYNGGPGNLRRWDKRLDIEDPLLFIESIPNSESRDFVEKVLTNVWVYRNRLGQPAPTRQKVAAGELPLYEAVDQLAESQ